MIEQLQPGQDVASSNWMKINELVDAVNQLRQIISAQPHLVAVTVNDGGVVLAFDGLVQALSQRGIQH